MSHEIGDNVGAEAVHMVEGNMCGTATRGADGLPGSGFLRACCSAPRCGATKKREKIPSPCMSITSSATDVQVSFRAHMLSLLGTAVGAKLHRTRRPNISLPYFLR
jgi:hypothetical protein